MKQELINYEFEILHNDLIRKDHSQNNLLRDPFRFSQWRLQQTLAQIPSLKATNQIRWIGNNQNSYVVAYFYCIMKICFKKNQNMIRLKHSLYKVSQYCLNLSQQRALVEFFHLMEQQKSVENAFKLYTYVESLLEKIFEGSLNFVKVDISNPEIQPLEVLRIYTKKIFPFLLVSHPLSSISVLEVKAQNCENIYIIQQKQCYFVVDTGQNIKIGINQVITEEAEEETFSKQRISRQKKKKKQQKNKHIPKFLQGSLGKKKQQPKTLVTEESQDKTSGKVKNQGRQNFANSLITNFKIPKTMTVSEEKKKKKQSKIEEYYKKKGVREKSKSKSKEKLFFKEYPVVPPQEAFQKKSDQKVRYRTPTKEEMQKKYPFSMGTISKSQENFGKEKSPKFQSRHLYGHSLHNQESKKT